jgi:hypothetical protein
MRMKTYNFNKSDVVSVDGQPLPMKRRSNEPRTYVSPDRLALSILADCFGSPTRPLCHEFQIDILKHCQAGEEITSEEIGEWKNFHCRIGASVQRAMLTPNRKEPPITTVEPLRLPHLLRVQEAPMP